MYLNTECIQVNPLPVQKSAAPMKRYSFLFGTFLGVYPNFLSDGSVLSPGFLFDGKVH